MMSFVWTHWRRMGPLAVGLVGLICAATVAAADYLDPALAFKGSTRVTGATALELRLDVAPDYHLYRERIAVTLESGAAKLDRIDIPHGKVQYDANLQQDVELLQGTVPIPVALRTQRGEIRLRVSYQGCADQGLCYPPQTAIVAASARDGRIERAVWLSEEAAAATPVASEPPAPAADANSSRIESALNSGNMPSIVGVFLVAGLLLSLTPCVLPMVPILSSIIVGQSGGAVSRRRGFTLALSYSLGMALVYTSLGVVAGLLGEGLAAALQNPWVLGTFALLLATLSLSMFGLFELQMPGFIQNRLAAASSRLPGGKHLGVFLMGGLSALIVGPCVAAPLAGALVFISRTHDVVIGGLALFSLAMGMSVPLLLVGVSAGSLLPRAGAWMEGVKHLFGVLLLGVALWLVAPVLPHWALMIIIGIALLVGAAYLKLFDRLAESASGRQRLAKGLALVLAVLGTTQVIGALSGGTNPLQPLRHLAQGGQTAPVAGTQEASFRRLRAGAELDAALASAKRPVILDFYADWCVSCKEMEHLTFSDPAVRERMGQALLLQADVTANTADDKLLLKRFGLFGPPGLLFFDAQGRERAEARVIGFLDAQGFAQMLTRAGL